MEPKTYFFFEAWIRTVQNMFPLDNPRNSAAVFFFCSNNYFCLIYVCSPEMFILRKILLLTAFKVPSHIFHKNLFPVTYLFQHPQQLFFSLTNFYSSLALTNFKYFLCWGYRKGPLFFLPIPKTECIPLFYQVQRHQQNS